MLHDGRLILHVGILAELRLVIPCGDLWVGRPDLATRAANVSNALLDNAATDAHMHCLAPTRRLLGGNQTKEQKQLENGSGICPAYRAK